MKKCSLWMVFAVQGFFVSTAWTMDIEPRRWGHLPKGGNFLSAGYLYTKADIYLDPVLKLDNVKMSLDTWAMKYVHSFELFGKSSRFDLTQAYQEGRWDGNLDGVPRTAQRQGLADTLVRFAMNLYGAPPLKGQDYAAWRKKATRETIVGVGVVVHLPTGDYMEDKLINLGSNRYTIRPQLGVTKTWGKWMGELTGESWIYTDNNEFFNGNKLEQDPLYFGQAHGIYTFSPGFWAGLSLGYSQGGESTINGTAKNDPRDAQVWGLSLGLPLARHWNSKIAYINTRAKKRIGQDTDNLALAISYGW